MRSFVVKCLCALWCLSSVYARTVEYDLTIREKWLSPAGKSTRALLINDSLPGPTLRFRQGDIAKITVRNRLPRGEVSTHWHGLLLPNSEDGVPYLTTPPILPGSSHVFQFPLTHAGTFWYHSHTGLQEQQGVYGALIVEPPGQKAMREEVIVLSDWTNERPEEVMRTLMRGSDWYNIRKGTAQSLWGAWQAGELNAFFKREKARLPAMDISDVAYDAFLINGQPRQQLAYRKGESIRLRIINAAASTYFYLGSGLGPLTIVAADGQDVRPFKQKRLLMGIGETYDIVVSSNEEASWELRATAFDGSGHASAIFGEGPPRLVKAPPEINLYNMNSSLGTVLDQLVATEPMTDSEALAKEPERPLSPYAKLRATKPTSLPTKAPVRKITIRLGGDMMRYRWTINGTTLSEDSVIPVSKGEVLQMEMINDSMMHHPMHLHGHFFRLLVPGGAPAAYAPLKHTVDVPPMGRRLIEFLANEEKDWAFHCHLLYHMHGGMMKVLSYQDKGESRVPKLDPADLNPIMWMVDGTLQTHMSMGMAKLMRGKDDLALMWDIGWGHDTMGPTVSHNGSPEHQHPMPSIEYEVDLMWQHSIDTNTMSLLGWRWTNKDEEESAALLGVMYRLPGLFDSQVTVESTGDVRIGLGKSIPLTARLGLMTHMSFDTSEQWMANVSLNYVVSKNLGLTLGYDSDHGLGGGLSFHF